MDDETWTPGSQPPEHPSAEAPPALSRFAHRERPVASPKATPARSAPPVSETKPSLWRRIAQARAPETEPGAKALLERMRALEVRHEADRAVSAERLARTERALDDLYRQQEDPALAELRERLVGLEIDQAEADEALRASVLRLKWLAGAVLALSLGLAAAALLLGLG